MNDTTGALLLKTKWYIFKLITDGCIVKHNLQLRLTIVIDINYRFVHRKSQK